MNLLKITFYAYSKERLEYIIGSEMPEIIFRSLVDADIDDSLIGIEYKICSSSDGLDWYALTA